MKHSFVIAAFVATAAAQIPSATLASDRAAVPPLSTFPANVRPIPSALAVVNNSVVALDTATGNFQGAGQVDSLNAAANAVVQTLQDETTALQPLAPITDSNLGDLVNVLPYVTLLGDYVNITAYDIIQKRQLFIDTCVGPLVLQQANSLNTASSNLITLVLAKIPSDAQSIAAGYIAPIQVALSSAISVFADQTTVPASCSSTSTGSGSSTTTGSTTTGSTLTTITTTTTSGTVTSGSIYPTATTGSSYPTSTPKNCYRRRNRRAALREI